MKKTIHKAILSWNFDKEEKWLNEMAAKGLCLVSVGLFKYVFEDCKPGEYKIRTQLLEKKPANPESQKYIEFIEETGAEHVCSYSSWVYFRKKTADGEFELFSDNESRTKYLNRVIKFLTFIISLNLFFGIQNLFTAFALESPMNYIGFLNIIIGIWGLFGIIRLLKKRNKIKKTGQLFE